MGIIPFLGKLTHRFPGWKHRFPGSGPKLWHRYKVYTDLPGGAVIKNLPAKAGDVGSIPGLGRSPRVADGNPLRSELLPSTQSYKVFLPGKFQGQRKLVGCIVL